MRLLEALDSSFSSVMRDQELEKCFFLSPWRTLTAVRIV